MYNLLRNIHWHDWQPTAVEQYDTPYIDFSAKPQMIETHDGGRLVKPMTRILYRCNTEGCAGLKVEVIEGRWTLAEIKGESKGVV